MGGILRDNLGEGNRESKIAARQWGGERLQTRFARHGLTPQRAPKQCPVNRVWRMLWGPFSGTE